MSLQFYHKLGKIARASLSHARLNNPSFYDSLVNRRIVATCGTHQQLSWISTSKKNRETITTDVVPTKKTQKEDKPEKIVSHAY